MEWSNETVRITIAGNGTRILEDVRSCIFDPFFTTKAVGKGTGLELRINYQIITEKHTGQIRSQSITKGGTESMITLPMTASCLL
jgi:two-component system, NtrC family, sensor kinase